MKVARKGAGTGGVPQTGGAISGNQVVPTEHAFSARLQEIQVYSGLIFEPHF
jgi:hypothetical protein